MERGDIMPVGASTARPVAYILIAFLIMAVLPCVSHSFDDRPILPDIEGWDGRETATTELDTPSGNQGVWLERTYYRETDRHSILLILMKGPGTSWSGLPNAPVFSDDGSIGSGATYRTITVGGFPAALETHPLTGRSLVVTTGKDETFTFETSYDDVDLQGFAEELLKSVNGKR